MVRWRRLENIHWNWTVLDWWYSFRLLRSCLRLWTLDTGYNHDNPYRPLGILDHTYWLQKYRREDPYEQYWVSDVNTSITRFDMRRVDVKSQRQYTETDNSKTYHVDGRRTAKYYWRRTSILLFSLVVNTGPLYPVDTHTL